MADLPVDRTTANTPAEHVADHNVLHATHNLIDGDGSNGQVLTRVGGVPTWAAPSGSLVLAAFTPTWTNLTVGNGTVVARYVEDGDLCYFRISLVLGSTTSMTPSAAISVSLPVAAHASGYQTVAAYYLDSTVRHYVGVGLIAPGGTTVALKHTESAGAGDVSTVGPASMWGTADIMVVSGSYETV